MNYVLDKACGRGRKGAGAKGTGAHAVSDIGLLCVAEQRDGGVGLWGQDVHQGVGVAVQGHAGAGLQELPVQGRQDPDVVVVACIRSRAEDEFPIL